jgi:hypothetical protein
MAKDTAVATDEEWEQVSEGARISVQFNQVGDTLIGTFMGFQTIEDPNTGESWQQALFDDVQFPADLKGEDVVTNPGYDLLRALEQIVPGKFRVRVQYARNIPIAGQPAPMKGYKVDRKAL